MSRVRVLILAGLSTLIGGGALCAYWACDSANLQSPPNLVQAAAPSTETAPILFMSQGTRGMDVPADTRFPGPLEFPFPGAKSTVLTRVGNIWFVGDTRLTAANWNEVVGRSVARRHSRQIVIASGSTDTMGPAIEAASRCVHFPVAAVLVYAGYR